MPHFSAVICTYERYDFLDRAIASLCAQTLKDGSFDIWVMDNSPGSDKRRASAQKYAGIENLHYLEIDRPGLSHARNMAIQKCAGDFILYLDDDAVAAPGWLDAYAAAFAGLGTAVGAIGGKVVAEFASPRPAWLDDRLLIYLSLCDLGDAVRMLEGSEEPVGANVAFRREALMRSGGFNPSLGRTGFEGHSLLSGEESDALRRIKSLGYQLGYAPQALATHHIPASRLTHAWFRKRAAWQAASDQMLYTLNDRGVEVFRAALAHYASLVPPEHAAYMGMTWDTDNPDIFFRQINAIGMFTRLMLAKGALGAHH